MYNNTSTPFNELAAIWRGGRLDLPRKRAGRHRLTVISVSARVQRRCWNWDRQGSDWQTSSRPSGWFYVEANQTVVPNSLQRNEAFYQKLNHSQSTDLRQGW